jgi:hypothetical protein
MGRHKNIARWVYCAICLLGLRDAPAWTFDARYDYRTHFSAVRDILPWSVLLCLFPAARQRESAARGPEVRREFPMTDIAVAEGRAAWRQKLGTETLAVPPKLDARRALQLGLAALWLLDGVLQYQGFMYTKGFSDSLAQTAPGNPGWIAAPITWDANLVQHNLALVNTVFATIQLLLGIGIAFRPTVKAALAVSIAWSAGVWWFGEGLGGVLNGGASPLNGAPGAVLLYALLALLLWPADRTAPAPFAAARAVGAAAARALWAVLWLSLAYFAMTPENRAPQGVNGMIADMESGEPGWVAGLLREAAALTARHGLAASSVLAVALIVIALGVYLPAPAAKAALLLALVVAALIWVFAEAFGAIMAGGATDPNSGPLLILLALAYWPSRPVPAVPMAGGPLTAAPFAAGPGRDRTVR